MLRDNLAGLIEPMLKGAGAYPLALATDRKELSDDRPQYASKIPARQGGIYALTENVASPFHAEPRHSVNAIDVTNPDSCAATRSAIRHRNPVQTLGRCSS